MSLKLLENIPIVSSIPAPGTIPTEAGALVLSSLSTNGNVLEIVGVATAGSGNLVLLRWYEDLEEWRPFRDERPIVVDHSELNGFFEASYNIPAGNEAFLLYDPDGAITAIAKGRGRSGVGGNVEPTPATPLPVDILLGQAALPVNIGSTVDRAVSGAITSTQTVAVSTAACGSVAVEVSGTWSGTLYFEKFVSSWTAVEAEPGAVTSTTANGSWTIACAGFQQVRVRGDVSSGSASVALNASTATSTVVLGEPLPAGAALIGKVQLAGNASGNLLDINTSGQAATRNGAGSQADGHSASIGATSDASSSFTLIGLLKKLISLLPTALIANRLDINNGAWLGSTAPTVGQKAMSASLPVTIASDQASFTIAVTGVSTTSNQTNGTQKTQVVDGSGNVAPAGDTVARAGFHKVTDGTNTAAVKAASTAAVAADPALVVAISPNNTPVLPTGAATAANQTNASQKTQVVDASGNVHPAGDTVARAIFEKITDGTNTAAVKASSTAAIASDPALVVAISPNNTELASRLNQTNGSQKTQIVSSGGVDLPFKAASTAAVASDPAVVVAISPNNTPVLPSGAATASNQTGGGQKTQVVDGSGNVHPSGDTVGRAIFVKPTDGTNVPAVKAASTASVATDASLVVQISPNNPGVAIFDPVNNLKPRVNPNRSLAVNQFTYLFGDSFDGSAADSELWTDTVTNSALVQHSGGASMFLARTFNQANATAKRVSTIKTPSYPGASFYIRFTGVFFLANTGQNANRTVRWGAFAESSFFGVGFDYTNGVIKPFIGDGISAFTLFTPTTTIVPDNGVGYHSYEIICDGTAFWFFQDGNLVYTQNTTSLAATSNAFDCYSNVPISFTVVQINGDTGDQGLYCHEVSVGLLGNLSSMLTRHYLVSANETRALKYGPGSLKAVTVMTAATASTITFYESSNGTGRIIGYFPTTTAGVVFQIPDRHFNLLSYTTAGMGAATLGIDFS